MRKRRIPICGTCQQCSQNFVSMTNKKYCSMSCYLASPQFKAVLLNNALIINRKSREGHTANPDERIKKPCLHCGQAFFVKPKEIKSHKYCSHVCYRAYMAERFDRWIASPQSIVLPQCYDEFLSQEALPCLIEGCNWVGDHLASHVNFAHGITAEKFKEMGGFNRASGLVTPQLSKYYSQRAKDLGLGNGPMLLECTIKRLKSGAKCIASSQRLEGKEHFRKAQAILRATAAPRRYICRQCVKEFDVVTVGSKHIYCSIKCRSAYYNVRRWDVTCNHCGLRFLGTRVQWRHASRGEVVLCSQQCTAARNLVLTPNHRKHAERSFHDPLNIAPN